MIVVEPKKRNHKARALSEYQNLQIQGVAQMAAIENIGRCTRGKGPLCLSDKAS